LCEGCGWSCAPEGKIGSTRRELDAWIGTLPQPRTIAMEATIFTGWICDHLLPHASADCRLSEGEPISGGSCVLFWDWQ
jgi:hypothetical protein